MAGLPDSARWLAASALPGLLRDQQELALLDVREQGVYSQAHLFFAVSASVSHLEIAVPRLVPRLSTRIVLCDGGEDDNALALRALNRLQQMGYTDLQVLQGGPDAWRQAGLEIFSGVNVPSKAFGEFVEHWHDTPRLPAQEVDAMQRRGENMVVLDSRPMKEFQRMSIPGGQDCPGAELVYRVHQVAPDPETTVVVNCAGRTRSIIGAQSLINAGVPNRVVALKDGTMGWELAGLTLATGQTNHAPAPVGEALGVARERAAEIARRYGVQRITPAQLAQWQSDAGRTVMLLDVRTEQEYIDGHWPGAQHAPGGQLVQATDEFVGTRNARLVLCDSEDGVRATMTAHWLIQLGWPEVRVMSESPEAPVQGLTTLTAPLRSALPVLSAVDLRAQLDGTNAPRLIDLSSSLRYRAGHLPGAQWCVRSRLVESLAGADRAAAIVVYAPSMALAQHAGADLRDAGFSAVSVHAEPLSAWTAAGAELETGMSHLLTEVNDVWFKPYDHEGEQEKFMQDYLTWEVGLVEQVEREGIANFRRFD